MNVKLISITPNAAELVAYCARVSNPANQDNHATAARLLAYLREHKHWSPFEMAHAVLEIETTRDIARQILRHRSFSFQEFSQRYAAADALPEGQLRQARLQDTKNRQNSLDTADERLHDWWAHAQGSVDEQARRVYREALDRGIAKEVARAVLPEGLTPSRMYMAGSFRSWLHYVEVRTGPETQKEHREIAHQCKAVLAEAAPEIFA